MSTLFSAIFYKSCGFTFLCDFLSGLKQMERVMSHTALYQSGFDHFNY